MLLTVFKNLPDELIQLIIDYANETPFRRIYDEKNRKWIRKTNPQFALLNKVCAFMLMYPPDYYIHSGYYNPNYYNPNFMNINPNHVRLDTIYLTITLPIKAEGKINTFKHEYTYYTMKIDYTGFCEISLLSYYNTICKKMIRKYKQKLIKKIDLTFKNRCKNMIKEFKEFHLYTPFEGKIVHGMYDYDLDDE